MIKNFSNRDDPVFGELVDHDFILESILKLRCIVPVQEPPSPAFDPHAEGLLIHLHRPCSHVESIWQAMPPKSDAHEHRYPPAGSTEHDPTFWHWLGFHAPESATARVERRSWLGDEIHKNDNTFHLPWTWRTRRFQVCLLYTSPSPRDGLLSRMPSSA